MDCIFCKIIKKEIPAKIIYEGEDCLAFLDINPNTHGHALAIPREHAADFSSMSEDAARRLIVGVHRIAPQLVKILGADGYNLALNNGQAAGQLVGHVHWHIIPRVNDDNLVHWPHSEVAKAKLEETYQNLKGMIK